MTDQPPDKAIWIDLDNSPHVSLFAPIIRHYREKGVEVILTARDHSQTIELLNLAGLQGTFFIVGRHYGKNRLNKILGLISRTADFAFLRKTNIAVAVSHGSRAMIFAAVGLNVPIITMYDYEYTETRIFNWLSHKILVPEAIPDEVLDKIRLPARKRAKYPGIKEELYVREFQPTPSFRQRFFENQGVDVGERVLAVLRPPATTANYHSEKSDVLFDDVLQFLRGALEVLTVVVPRTAEQAANVKARLAQFPDARARFLVLDKAVNGLDLLYAADLVISGGGTMNREAALLGVPVHSIFAGRQGALDRGMEAEGLITFIRDARDLSKIRLERRRQQERNTLTDRVERFVIDQIDRYL